MILQAANSGGATPFERYNDPRAFLFDPLLQVAQLDLKLAQLGLMGIALHPRGTVTCSLGILVFHLAINLVGVLTIQTDEW
jgi:hypothetical protein